MNQASLEAIKMGLMQYIGALLETSNREGEEAAHVTLASLSEVWLECCKNDNGYSLFVGKPVLRAASFLIRDYVNRLINDAKDNESVLACITPKLMEYNNAIKILDELVEQIKEDTADESNGSE